MQVNERIAGADLMRAVACMLVLIHHLVIRLDFKRIDPEFRSLLDVLRFGNFGVAVFFVLSGFLLARPFWSALDTGRELPDLLSYTLRRAGRLLPGYWLALTVAFVLGFTVFRAALDFEASLRYAAGFFLVSGWHWRTFFPVEDNGPLWSISFEATSYVLLPLAFLALNRLPAVILRPLHGRLAWLVIITLAFTIHALISSVIQLTTEGRGWQYGAVGGAKEWMPRFNPIGFFVVFAIGSLAAGVETSMARRKAAVFDLLALATLIFAATRMMFAVGSSYEAYGWFGIPYDFPVFPASVAVALLFLARSRWIGGLLDNPATRYVARISFGIYVWQELVLRGMRVLDPTSFGVGTAGDPLQPWLLSCALAVFAIMSIASASYYLLEAPFIRLAARRAALARIAYVRHVS